MPDTCKVCIDKNRLQVDREIVSGGNLTKISKKYGLPYHSVYNHAREHISRQLAQAWSKKEVEEGFDMLARIDDLLRKAENIFTRNYRAKKDGLALKALSESRNTLDLLQRISFSLHQAKLAEIELARERRGESEFQLQEQFTQDLKILNDAELEVFDKLIQKITHQSKWTTVIKDKSNEFQPALNEKPKMTRNLPRSRNKPYTDTSSRENLANSAGSCEDSDGLDAYKGVKSVDPRPIPAESEKPHGFTKLKKRK